MTPLQYCRHPLSLFKHNGRRKSSETDVEPALVSPHEDHSHSKRISIESTTSHPRSSDGYRSASLSSASTSPGSQSATHRSFAPRSYSQYSARLFELDELEMARTQTNVEEQQLLNQVLLDKVVAEVNGLYTNREALSDAACVHRANAEMERSRLYACNDCTSDRSRIFHPRSALHMHSAAKSRRGPWKPARVHSCEW